MDGLLCVATFEEQFTVRRRSLICHVPTWHATSALMSAAKFTTIVTLWDYDPFAFILFHGTITITSVTLYAVNCFLMHRVSA